MQEASVAEPITLPAPAELTTERAYDLAERARTFRILRQERDCPASSDSVIVVCAPEDPERYRYRAGPPPPTTMEELKEASRVKIGPVEADIVQMPTLHGAPSIGVRARIRF